MPSLSELPSDLNRNKLIRALIRLGFRVDKTGGEGSEIKEFKMEKVLLRAYVRVYGLERK